MSPTQPRTSSVVEKTESSVSRWAVSSLISRRASASSSFMTTLVTFCEAEEGAASSAAVYERQVIRRRTHADPRVEPDKTVNDILPDRLASAQRASKAPASEGRAAERERRALKTGRRGRLPA